MTTESKYEKIVDNRRIGKRLKRPLLVNSILKSTLARLGIDKELARYRFVQHWSEIVGDDIAKKTRPESLKNGRLLVKVSDSAWAQELSFQREVILKRLSRFVEKGTVLREVVFQVGL